MIPYGPVCTNLCRLLDYECDEIDALRQAFSVEHECFFWDLASKHVEWQEYVAFGCWFRFVSLLASCWLLCWPPNTMMGFGNSAMHLALARTIHCSTFTTPYQHQHQRQLSSKRGKKNHLNTASCSSSSSCCPEPQADPGCRTTLAILTNARRCMRGNNPSGHSGAIRRARGCAITSHNHRQTSPNQPDAEDHCRMMMNKDVARSRTF